VPAALAKDFCPREKIVKAWKPNLLRREVGLVSAHGHRSTYAKAYLSCLDWDILPNSFPLTGRSTSVSSGNGGGENYSSVTTFAHVECSPQSVVLNICCQDFSQIFENHVHLCFSNMFNMFEH
jgi:hypothetical protein